MSRYTIANLRADIQEVNERLIEAGSKLLAEENPRNGYQAVDAYTVDDNGQRVGTGVNNIGCGTSREVNDYLQGWFYNEINRLDKLQNFGAGELAYIDCFTGLVPCKVLQVVESGTPTQCVTSGNLTVRVTAKRGAYRVGEVIENQTCHKIVPRAMVRVSGGKYRVNTSYQWVN